MEKLQTPATKGSKLKRRLSYALKTLPSYFWQQLTRRSPIGPVHLIIAIADHLSRAACRAISRDMRLRTFRNNG